MHKSLLNASMYKYVTQAPLGWARRTQKQLFPLLPFELFSKEVNVVKKVKTIPKATFSASKHS